MKKHLYTLLNILCIAYLVCAFSACDSGLKINDEREIRALLGLDDKESRFYQMQGTIGEDDISAYMWITDDISGHFPNRTMHFIIEARGHYNSSFNSNERLYLPLSKVHIGLESGAVVVKGVWDVENSQGFENSSFIDKPFRLKQHIGANISEISTFSVGLDNDLDALHYNAIKQGALITSHNKLQADTIDMLNKAISSDTQKIALIKHLQNKLESSLKLILDNNDNKLPSNMEELAFESVLYIDNNILILKDLDYLYTGGAHGNSMVRIRAFDINNGKGISAFGKDLIMQDKQEAFLAILTKIVLEERGEDVFAEAMPLDSMPEYFFVSDRGFVFIFEPYSIAPYAAGRIEITISFDSIKEFINPNSPYFYLVK